MKALIGLHNEDSREANVDFIKGFHYEVKAVGSVEEMLKEMGVQDGKLTNHFDRYFMDVNLGKPGELDIQAGLTVYGYVKDYVEKGKVKFLAISGLQETVELAVNAGIPCILRSNIDEVIKFLG